MQGGELGETDGEFFSQLETKTKRRCRLLGRHETGKRGAAVQIDDQATQALFEIHAVLALKTRRYNDFRTH